MVDVQLDYAVPTEDLAKYVTLFYYFRADVEKFSDIERADYAQLRFRMTASRAGYTFSDGVTQIADEVHLLGPTCGPVRSWSEGPVRVFGLGLTAAGWAAMVGTDASNMLHRCVDAIELFGPAQLRPALDALARAETIDDCVAVAAPVVRALIHAHGAGTLAFVRQVDEWLAASPSPDMDDLVALSGLSRRQVERKCKAMYGAPPKLLARKYRALQAAVALASKAETVDEVIARGFYDQSHMIREVKEFTGLTPRQFQIDPGLLAQLVTAQRTALGDQVSSLVSRT